MNWSHYITQFKQYLKLERSLSPNTLEAYIHDVAKFEQFLALRQIDIDALETNESHLQDYLE